MDTSDQTQVTDQSTLDSLSTENVQGQEKVDDLFTIESAIRENSRLIDEIKDELKKQKEMLDSYLLNDQPYKDATETAKKANQLKNQAKQHALAQPGAAGLPEKIIDLKTEIKDKQEALSYYLREYQRQTGLNEIEGADGELRQIVYVAKLVKRSVFKK